MRIQTNVPGKIIIGMLIAIVLLGYLPATVSAHHSLTFNVDKPNGYYISGKDKVTFTATNNGADTAYVSCTGVWVYDSQNNLVAYELTPLRQCTGEGYQIDSGAKHDWAWDQKDSKGNQAANGKYYGYLEVYDKNGNQKTYTTNDFYIDSDSDGDGLADAIDPCKDDSQNKCVNQPNKDGDAYPDSEDKCPETYGNGAGNAAGCPDFDNDGVADVMDDGSHPDKCRPIGGGIIDVTGLQEDYNPNERYNPGGRMDNDGCPDQWLIDDWKKANAVTADTYQNVAYGMSVAAGFARFGGPVGAGTSAGLSVGEAIVSLFVVPAYRQAANDPPDLLNYKLFAVPKVPSAYFSTTVSKLNEEWQAMLNSAYWQGSIVESLVRSVERSDGAIIAGDYQTALAQAKNVREYALLESQLLGNYIESAQQVANSDSVMQLDAATMEAANRQFRAILLAEGINGLPEEERKLIVEEGAEQQLPEFYDWNLRMSEGDIGALSSRISDSVRAAQDMQTGYELLSKTFGTNLYLKSAWNPDGTLSLGAYYERVPNPASKFAIEITKPEGLKLAKLYKSPKLADWYVVALESSPDKLLLIGFASPNSKSLDVGAQGWLLDLQFTRAAAAGSAENYAFDVSKTYFDMSGWLTAPDILQPAPRNSYGIVASAVMPAMPATATAANSQGRSEDGGGV